MYFRIVLVQLGIFLNEIHRLVFLKKNLLIFSFTNLLQSYTGHAVHFSFLIKLQFGSGENGLLGEISRLLAFIDSLAQRKSSYRISYNFSGRCLAAVPFWFCSRDSICVHCQSILKAHPGKDSTL